VPFENDLGVCELAVAAVDDALRDEPFDTYIGGRGDEDTDSRLVRHVLENLDNPGCPQPTVERSDRLQTTRYSVGRKGPSVSSRRSDQVTGRSVSRNRIDPSARISGSVLRGFARRLSRIHARCDLS
jgi:hypothetical protein